MHAEDGKGKRKQVALSGAVPQVILGEQEGVELDIHHFDSSFLVYTFQLSL